jgi:ATP-binding cassette subfamily F protein uup
MFQYQDHWLAHQVQEYWYIHGGQLERIIGTFEDYEAYKKEKDRQDTNLRMFQ